MEQRQKTMETTIHIPLIPAVKKPEAFHLMGERSDSMHAHHAADSMHAHHAYASKNMHDAPLSLAPAPQQQQFVRRFEHGQKPRRCEY